MGVIYNVLPTRIHLNGCILVVCGGREGINLTWYGDYGTMSDGSLRAFNRINLK